MSRSKKNLKLAFYNAGSLNTGHNDFLVAVSVFNPDIIGINESWLRQGQQACAPAPPGYKLKMTPRPNHILGGRGGGVAFYVRTDIRVRFHKPPNNGVEQMWLTMQANGHKIAIGTAYRPPWQNVDIFLDSLTESVMHFSHNEHIVLLGDFNINMLEVSSSDCVKLRQTLQCLDLEQLVDEPTHFSVGNETLIDLVCTNARATQVNVTNITGGLGHAMINVQFLFKKKKMPSKLVTYRPIKDINLELFSHDLESLDWESVLSESTVDAMPQTIGDDRDFEDSSDSKGSSEDEFKEAGVINPGTKELLDTLEKEKANPEGSKDEDKEDQTPGSGLSDDEEKYPAEILKFMKNRTKRYAPRREHRRRHAGKSRRRRSTHTLFSKVKLPSGKIATVTIPQAKYKNFKCGDKTRLITLRPHGTMGRVEYSLIADEMEKTRRSHRSFSFSGYNIISIEKIVNPCLWRRYRHRRREVLNETKYTDEQLLFHGSPAYSILVEKGMDERYAGLQTNMFGAGLYFARHSSKSNQYSLASVLSGGGCSQHQDKNCMVCERVLLLCRVILGNAKEYTQAEILPHPPVNYHSVKGVATQGGLQYDEFVVYKGDQVYPEFMIKYTLKP